MEKGKARFSCTRLQKQLKHHHKRVKLMDLIHAGILGIVQGATEYLPVSSSAHLVLVPAFLGWQAHDEQIHFLFDVLVQVGTLVGVFVYFWKDLMAVLKGLLKGLTARDLKDPGALLGLQIVLATLPAVVIGLLFKDHLESFSLTRKPPSIF